MAVVVRRVVHGNVPVAQRVGDARRSFHKARLTMTFESTAHEHIQPVFLRKQDDGKRDVCVAPQMDVMRIRDVVDDEVAGVERLSLLVSVLVSVRLFAQSWTRKRHKGRQKEV